MLVRKTTYHALLFDGGASELPFKTLASLFSLRPLKYCLKSLAMG
jgi:hypothetical protein